MSQTQIFYEKLASLYQLSKDFAHYNSTKSRNFNVRWNLPLHWNLKFQVSDFSQVSLFCKQGFRDTKALLVGETPQSP